MKLSLFKLKILLYHGYCILSFIYHKVFWVNYGNIFGVLQSAPLQNAPEDVLKGAFMNGLADEIRCDVKLMHPGSLKELMNYAGQVEARN